MNNKILILREASSRKAPRRLYRLWVYGLIGLVLLGVVFASTWVNQGSDLSSGTFSDTSYNSTILAVELNRTASGDYAWNGTYTSAVKDMESTVKFLNLSWGGKPQTCPANMAYIDKLGGFCIDKYEASCFNADGTFNSTSTTTGWGAGDTDSALGNSAYAGSSLGKYPWVYINQTAARTACSNAGKYLCTSEQWLSAANIGGKVYNLPTGADTANNIPSGAADLDACVTHSNARAQNLGPNSGDADGTGNHSECVSQEGVYDMVGNVWEWTNETVDVTNPGGGANWYYVNVTDMSWSLSSSADDGTYGKDGCYFPATDTGRAVLRGGGWDSGAYAGVFCAYLAYAPSSTDYSVGFRCCAAPN